MIKFIVDIEGLKNDPKVPKKIKENPYMIIPKRATKHSAGYDLTLPYDVEITNFNSGMVKVNSYIKILMDSDYVAYMHVRSSTALKRYTRLTNCVGVIDSDYRDNIIIPLEIFRLQSEEFRAGEKVAQIVFHKYALTDNDTLEKGKTRTGGIGSTDEK